MTHRDTGWIDIGSGHLVSFRYAILQHTDMTTSPHLATTSEVLAGLRDRHHGGNEDWCWTSGGWIPFANAPEPFGPDEHGWTVENWDQSHFTLSPSLLCSVCGDHGFIRDGTWVPA